MIDSDAVDYAAVQEWVIFVITREMKLHKLSTVLRGQAQADLLLQDKFFLIIDDF